MNAASIDRLGDAITDAAESPVWRPCDASIWWLDISKHCLLCTSLASAQTRSWSLPSAPGCIALAADDTIVLALADGWYQFDEESGEAWLLQHRPGDLDLRFNDGCVDPAGRFWAGTIAPDRSARGRLWSLGKEGSRASAISDLRVQNGLAFSPDGKVLYVADSHAERRLVHACQFDVDAGTVGDAGVFCDCQAFPGRPDGAAIDAEGCYWLAAIDGARIVRLTPSGKLDMQIELPMARPTNLAFAGDALDVLVITSMRSGLDPQEIYEQPLAGALTVVKAPVRGHEVTRFRHLVPTA